MTLTVTPFHNHSETHVLVSGGRQLRTAGYLLHAVHSAIAPPFYFKLFQQLGFIEYLREYFKSQISTSTIIKARNAYVSIRQPWEILST